jgi:serine protease Do
MNPQFRDHRGQSPAYVRMALACVLSMLLPSACVPDRRNKAGDTEDRKQDDSTGAREDGAASPASRVTSRIASARTPVAARELSKAFAHVAESTRKGVVRVEVELPPSGSDSTLPEGQPNAPANSELPHGLRRFLGIAEPGAGARGTVRVAGSGLILEEPSGFVLTNSHLIHDALRLTLVTSNGEHFPAEFVGEDPITDIGVLRFQKTPLNLVSAPLGKSSELTVGQWVIAAGGAMGQDQTISAGIVSALGETGGRLRPSGERVRRFIRTDAHINPANSGGPLLNLLGEVVGISTFYQLGTAGEYGFAVPIEQAEQIAWLVAKEGRLRRPHIGAVLGDVQDLPEQARAQLPANHGLTGAFVNEVTPGGPADQAGVRPGDVITAFGGGEIEDARDLIEHISASRIAESVELSLVHDGKARTAKVVIAELPSSNDAEVEGSELGLTLQTLTGTMAISLGLKPDLHGAIIVEVGGGSAAQKAGLAAGDVIVKIDQHEVTSADEALSVLKSTTGRPRLFRLAGARRPRLVAVQSD